MAADYLRIEITKALARLAAAHPTLDFGVVTPDVDAAEAVLNAAMDAWSKGGSLRDVWRALGRYGDALLAAHRTQQSLYD